MRYILTLVVLLMLVSCGSYFYAESYNIQCSEKDFVHKVDSFKSVHPEYKWTARKSDGTLVEAGGARAPFSSMGDTALLHFDFVFYIPSENKLFQCHIVPYDSLSFQNEFSLLFSSVSDTDYIENYHLNTRESTRKEDARYKCLFEELILEKLSVNWKK